MLLASYPFKATSCSCIPLVIDHIECASTDDLAVTLLHIYYIISSVASLHQCRQLRLPLQPQARIAYNISQITNLVSGFLQRQFFFWYLQPRFNALR